MTLFNSDVTLNKSINWLRDLDYRMSKNGEDKSNKKLTLDNIIQFINKSELLPKGAIVKEVNPDGVFISDINNNTLSLMEMSDGYRSILSLLLDLIRQMSINSGDSIFKKEESGKIVIQLSGVVMIDEIDVHFHPKWQARIGQWFTDFFPNIQFIVTTHSPIICQSAKNGSIWQMEATSQGSKVKKIVGQDFKRLVYGNILNETFL